MKSVVLNIHGKCTATCKHCCFNCSPKNSEIISDSKIDEILLYVKENNVKQVAITGGEPFLREQKVFYIINKVHDMNKKVTCITNGYWAVSYEKALEKLKKLENLGLDALTISYDEFHKEYIPIQKYKIYFVQLKKLTYVLLLICVYQKNKMVMILLSV